MNVSLWCSLLAILKLSGQGLNNVENICLVQFYLVMTIRLLQFLSIYIFLIQEHGQRSVLTCNNHCYTYCNCPEPSNSPDKSQRRKELVHPRPSKPDANTQILVYSSLNDDIHCVKCRYFSVQASVGSVQACSFAWYCFDTLF